MAGLRLRHHYFFLKPGKEAIASNRIKALNAGNEMIRKRITRNQSIICSQTQKRKQVRTCDGNHS